MTAKAPRRPRATALALALALWACGDPREATAPQRSFGGAKLADLRGEVAIQGRLPGEVLSGTALVAGDVIGTGDASGATVRLEDGRSLALGPRTRVRLREVDGRLEVEVLEGRVLSRSGAEESRIELRILTPQGMTRLGRGPSDLEVQVGADGSVSVEVRMGRVEFAHGQEPARQISTGERLVVEAGALRILSRGDSERPAEEARPLRATLDPAGGQAEVRKRGASRFRAAGPLPVALESGEEVRGKKGQPQLRFEAPGALLTLERGAALLFEQAQQKGAGSSAQLQLQRGALGVTLEPGRPFRLGLDGLTLVAEAGGRLRVERKGQGYVVESSAGDAELEHAGGKETLRSGTRLRLAPGRDTLSEALALSTVRLSPAAGQRIFHTRLGEVSLVWEGGEGDAFVEVATDSAFLKTLVAGTVHAPFVNVPAPERGTLYWRVLTADRKRLLHAGSAHFAPEPKARRLARVQNEVPEDAERTTILFQDRPPALTLTFRAEPKAAAYRLVVYREDALEEAVLDRRVREPRITLAAGVLGEGRYVWSATPMDPSGAPLRAGRMTPLELAYDNAVTGLVVEAPKEGQRVRPGGLVEVAGIAPVRSRMTVNGQPAPLDAKHRFRVRVLPEGQPPTLVLRSTQAGRPDLVTVRTLQAKGPPAGERNEGAPQ